MKKIISLLLIIITMLQYSCVYAEWKISDTEYSELLAMVENTNSDKEIGTFGDSMSYTLENNSDGYYIKRFGRTSTGSNSIIFKLENGNFIEQTSFAREINKDSVPYVTTYSINGNTVTEDEYNQESNFYNNTVIASTNLSSYPIG